MSQILAADDAFTEGSPVYGDWLTGYARFNPWHAAGSGGEGVSGFSIRNNGSPSLHDGYSAVTTTPASTSAAFKNNVAAPTRVFSACLWRPYVAANCTASMSFVPHVVAGNPNTSSWSYAGVCVRASGSPTFGTTAGQEITLDGDSYWFILANSSSATKWLLLRVKAGVVALLDSVDESRPAWEAPSEISLAVTTTGGDPVLTAKTKLYTSHFSGYPVQLDGTPGEWTIFTHTDSHADKITASGRCGFGTSQEHNQSSGAIRTVTLVPWFQIYDAVSAQVKHRDEWKRVSPFMHGSYTADTISVAGRSLMCSFVGDSAGLFTRVLARDAGNNRITVASPGQTHIMSTRPASSPYTQDRSVVFNILNPSNTLTTAGLTLRASWPIGGASSVSGYRFSVVNSAGVWSAAVYRIGSGGAQVSLASNADLTSFGLALNADFTMRMAVTNIGGSSEANGTPMLTCTINGVSPVWTNQAGIAVQIDADDNILHVGATGDLLQGQAQGIVAVPGTSATIRFDTWTDVVAAEQGITPDEMESIAVGFEDDGATGTLVFPYDWPVEEERIYRTMEHIYDSGHVQLMPWDQTPRRRWRIFAGALTETERDDLKDFYDTHKGPQIPFTWVEPGGESITAHFVDDELGIALRGPGSYSFSFSIEELAR